MLIPWQAAAPPRGPQKTVPALECTSGLDTVHWHVPAYIGMHARHKVIITCMGSRRELPELWVLEKLGAVLCG